jgi:hypothetical protein
MIGSEREREGEGEGERERDRKYVILKDWRISCKRESDERMRGGPFSPKTKGTERWRINRRYVP